MTLFLKHVPAAQFGGPDALSRRQPAEDEEVENYDDSWLEEIALLITVSEQCAVPRFNFHKVTWLPYKVLTLPSSQPHLSCPDQLLVDVQRFLEILDIPQDPFKLGSGR